MEEKSWRRVCRSCGRINYFNPRVVAGVIPLLKGKVVLGRRAIEPAHGFWGFPCGYVELGESVEEAAIREAREEIALKVVIKSLVGVFSYSDAAVVTVVYAGSVNKSQKPRATHETLEVAAFSPKDIPWNRLAFRSTRDALKTWIKQAYF